MHEAFCLESEREKYQPEKIHHCTVKETACIARSMQVRNLVIYHTVDNALNNRKQEYIKEARQYYCGVESLEAGGWRWLRLSQKVECE